MDNRPAWEKFATRLLHYWTGFCIGWYTFAHPPIGTFALTVAIGMIGVIALGFILFAVETWLI
jgi:hypothetical protein